MGSGDMRGMGHLALPQLEALPPHTPYKNKTGKNQPFLFFLYFCPLTPTPTPTKNNLVQPLENLVLRLVKIFSGVKIHAIWRLVLNVTSGNPCAYVNMQLEIQPGTQKKFVRNKAIPSRAREPAALAIYAPLRRFRWF